jgi:anti-sigma regulatory factor (Ser/Thr protein kinase)
MADKECIVVDHPDSPSGGSGLPIRPALPLAARSLRIGEVTDDQLGRTLELTVDRATYRRADEALRLACADWGLHAVTEDAAIALAELVQNAVRHATCVAVSPQGHPRTRTITLVLRRLPALGRLLVGVRDGDPRPPVRRQLTDLARFDPSDPAHLDALEECGRGLWTIEKLADRFGWYPQPPVGKLVWCEFTTPTAPTES